MKKRVVPVLGVSELRVWYVGMWSVFIVVVVFIVFIAVDFVVDLDGHDEKA